MALPRAVCGGRLQAGRACPRTPGPERARTTLAFLMLMLFTIRGSLAWWPWHKETPSPVLQDVLPFNLTMLYGEDAGQDWLDGSTSNQASSRRSSATPPPWDSSECMMRWAVPDLQREVDRRGYVIFSEGREQLGNNRFLLSDGLAIAKALDRTLVEFPMTNSRIATPDAELGFCDYWDCDTLCSYHRILDLETFRSFLRHGLLSAEGFVSIVSADWEQRLLPSMETAENMTAFFAEYDAWQVIDLKMAWKSEIRRDVLEFLVPNPFYLVLVDQLLAKQNAWRGGHFLAVQWRTEMSTGNLSDCYVRYAAEAVEMHRKALGYRRDQVYVNVDLVGQASTTYNASVVQSNSEVVKMIRADYPAALDNTVYDLLEIEQDAGVRAMVTGLVSASANFLLSSSFNVSRSDLCQKPHSKYIDLVVEWRLHLEGRSTGSIGQLFPSVENAQPESRSALHTVLFVAAVVVCVICGARRARAPKRMKST